MDPTTSSAETSSRRGWNALPAELKAEIVAIAARKDEGFRQWLDTPQKVELAKELKKNHLMHGRSLSALFRCNKKLAMLAAPHHFKVRCPFSALPLQHIAQSFP